MPECYVVSVARQQKVMLAVIHLQSVETLVVLLNQTNIYFNLLFL